MTLNNVHEARRIHETAQQRLRWSVSAAVRSGDSKTSVALAADITRPTLDAWLDKDQPTISTSGDIRYGTTHVGWLTQTSPRILTTAPYQDDKNRFGYAVATTHPHTQIDYSVADHDGKAQLWRDLDQLLGL